MKRDNLEVFEIVLRKEVESLEGTKKSLAGIFESTDNQDVLESFKVISTNLSEAISKARRALSETHYVLITQREG